MSRIRSKDTAPEPLVGRLRSQTPRKASTVVLKRTPAAPPCKPEGARTPEQGHPQGQARNLEQAARNLEQRRKLEQARKPAAARAAALLMQGHRQRLRPTNRRPDCRTRNATDGYRRNTPNYCAGRSSSHVRRVSHRVGRARSKSGNE